MDEPPNVRGQAKLSADLGAGFQHSTCGIVAPAASD
jgi:hypothetical protein